MFSTLAKDHTRNPVADKDIASHVMPEWVQLIHPSHADRESNKMKSLRSAAFQASRCVVMDYGEQSFYITHFVPTPLAQNAVAVLQWAMANLLDAHMSPPQKFAHRPPVALTGEPKKPRQVE